ncbi:hypothetical protein AGMMS49949_09460 [Alphaproteobacteria bacterium]|nr:hypothetical protein AGMMS49949_09460 [Alphaproteobacteria bacterium]
MKKFLAQEEREALQKQHRSEKDRRVADRMKAVLLADAGVEVKILAKFLLVNRATVGQHIKDYKTQKKLTLTSGGSEGYLTKEQTEELLAPLREHVYATTLEICQYIEQTYDVLYHFRSRTLWLKEHGFSYKKPAPVSAKANPAEQAKFRAAYEKFLAEKPAYEPAFFVDAVHPTMGTKLSYGWIPTGEDHPIPTTASRTRGNILGAVHRKTMPIIKDTYDMINSCGQKIFRHRREEIPDVKIHAFLDNGGYFKSLEARKYAEKLNIKLHFSQRTARTSIP